ncbi:MAG: YchJ family protein [Candidatus Marinamargulisbacteria bacterium]
MSQCHCGQSKELNRCCLPIINGKKIAQTALELMRSRFSAYVENHFEYLNQTVIGEAATAVGDYDSSIIWEQLVICRVLNGEAHHNVGTVEFKAFYRTPNNTRHMLWEESQFKKQQGKWFYEAGVILHEH